MLTIYEQVQRSVDLIEEHLEDGISAEAAARTASMSVRSFHRYFPALTGYRFGEYVRKRRLSRALDDLTDTDASVLEIALRSGYDSHEAFTRAFKKEFGVAPLRFRTDGRTAPRTSRIDLVGEVMMGVLTRSLPDMTVVCFDGFRPDPELTALQAMEAWLEDHEEILESHRVFGHNIDRDGRLSHEPENEGYRVMVTVPESVPPSEDGTRTMTIEGGKYIVTGIEGSFDEDPTGSWITAGWRRLHEMMKRNGIEGHPSHRYFEEHLEPVEPGRTRFDLYLEIV